MRDSLESSKAPAAVRRVRRFGSASLFAVATFAPAFAHAEGPRIAVAHRAADAAARRLVAEVRNVGLLPVDIKSKAGKSVAPSRVAAEYDAVAVLTLGKQGSIDVAVVDPDTRQVVYESTVSSKGNTPASLRAVEELHGRLVDMNLADPEATKAAASAFLADGVSDAPPSDAKPPRDDAHSAIEDALHGAEPALPISESPSTSSDVTRDEVSSASRGSRSDLDGTGLWLGGSFGLMSGGTHLSGVPATKLELTAAVDRWSASAFAFLPLEPQTTSGTGGMADVSPRIFGGMVHFVPVELGRAFLSLGLGGGAGVIAMSGHPTSSNFAGRDGTVLTAMGLAGVGVGVRALPWLSVRADATGGLAAHRPVVEFAGQGMAAWGPTFIAGTLGVELDTSRIFGFGGT
jgi:hypothetical protein